MSLWHPGCKIQPDRLILLHVNIRNIYMHILFVSIYIYICIYIYMYIYIYVYTIYTCVLVHIYIYRLCIYIYLQFSTVQVQYITYPQGEVASPSIASPSGRCVLGGPMVGLWSHDDLEVDFIVHQWDLRREPGTRHLKCAGHDWAKISS